MNKKEIKNFEIFNFNKKKYEFNHTFPILFIGQIFAITIP